MSTDLSDFSDLPTSYAPNQGGALAWFAGVANRINAIIDVVSDLSGPGSGSDPFTSDDAVTAINAAINAGVHTGVASAVNGATGGLDLKLTYPVLPLAAGAPVPAGTPVNTVILRIG